MLCLGPDPGVMPGVRPHLGAEHAGEAGGALGAVGARGAHRTRDQLRVHVPVQNRVIVNSLLLDVFEETYWT